MVARLKQSLDDQMKAFASAKEHKAGKTPPPAAPTKADTTNTGGSQSRWASGELVSEPEVLASPDTVVSQIEAKLSRGGKKPDENPTFANVLDQVSAILVKNNRAGEAGKYQQRSAAIRAALAKKK
jgi:hypothetical protein